MSKGEKPPMIYLTKDEYKAVQLGLSNILEDFKATRLLPWNSESRKDMKDIMAATKSAAAKIEKITGIKAILPPYIDGEEKYYFTKES